MSEISILDVNFDSESNVFKELKYPDALNGYYNGSKLIDLPELYLTAEDYDRIYKEVIAEFKEEK